MSLYFGAEQPWLPIRSKPKLYIVNKPMLNYFWNKTPDSSFVAGRSDNSPCSLFYWKNHNMLLQTTTHHHCSSSHLLNGFKAIHQLLDDDCSSFPFLYGIDDDNIFNDDADVD